MTTKTIVCDKVEIVVYNTRKQIMILAPCKRSPWWAIPGGGIEEGEVDKTAAVRECLEEAGCKIKNLQSLGAPVVFDGVYSGRHVRKLTRFYMAEFDGVDKSRFNADGDGRTVHWMTAEEAASKLAETAFDIPRRSAIFTTKEMIG